MSDASTGSLPDPALHAFRTSALMVGTIAVCSVALTQVLPSVLFEVLMWSTSDPTTGAAPRVFGAIGELAWFLGTVLLPLLAMLLAFYLTAARDLPAAPVAAGAFLGSLLAPIGFVLGEVYLRPLDTVLVSGEAFYTFATVTLVFVVPVFLAALFGGIIDELWEQGVRWRGLRS